MTHICKGKNVFSNKWEIGYYVAAPWDNGSGVAHLIVTQDAEYKGGGDFSPKMVRRVYPNTICRYTGMIEFVMADKLVCDPLFEGDIVEVWSRRRPPGEDIVLFRKKTTSQYDIQTKVRAVICFKNGKWMLDYDNAYNNAICQIKGNEQVERIVKANPSLYGFGYHGGDESRFRENNQKCKWLDIVKIGNIHDNKELLEA